MIRRERGREFLLISQVDHARLSGRIAEAFGNERFARPEPWAPTIAACAHHDEGWVLHDEAPTLNRYHQPVDVFEMPLLVALRVWEESVSRVLAAHGEYAGLLVSLHVLGLSAYAGSRPHDNRELFELNKFQHRQYERQDELRRKVGLRTDVALKQGFAAAGTSAADDWLAYNFGVLQVVDRLSLEILCTKSMFPRIEGVQPRPGEPAMTIRCARGGDTKLRARPWPFACDRLRFDVAAKVTAARTYRTVEEFGQAYAAAPVEELHLEIAAE